MFLFTNLLLESESTIFLLLERIWPKVKFSTSAGISKICRNVNLLLSLWIDGNSNVFSSPFSKLLVSLIIFLCVNSIIWCILQPCNLQSWSKSSLITSIIFPFWCFGRHQTFNIFKQYYIEFAYVPIILKHSRYNSPLSRHKHGNYQRLKIKLTVNQLD